ncbi:hypothetical protein DH2020_040097 [Rehmannia glutinosa]|uniref:THO1-MOS11 C-terminal domain-containing protein n=1 Tax=Rehmannia glutinosa TaxID=99300 RepID=A0ABR0UV19_REHGL
MATATETKLESPKNSPDVNSKPPATEGDLSNQTLASSGGGGDESKGEPAAERTGDTRDGGAVTDIDKKMKRAERFGMPVQMTEEEKRNSRAESDAGRDRHPRSISFLLRRILLYAAISGRKAINLSNRLFELKVWHWFCGQRIRFGIGQSDPSDEEAKRRLDLLGLGLSPRLIRFSQPDSASKANGKKNIEVKTDIAGKAGGGT